MQRAGPTAERTLDPAKDVHGELEPRPRIREQPRPQSDIGRIEIPQCSSLLLCRGVLSFLSEAREASGSETPRVHHAARRRGGVAARGARVLARKATHPRFL